MQQKPRASAKKSNIPSLSDFRKQRGLTQVALARYLDVDRATVSNWERGAVPIPYCARLAIRHYDCEHPRISV